MGGGGQHFECVITFTTDQVSVCPMDNFCEHLCELLELMANILLPNTPDEQRSKKVGLFVGKCG